MAAQTCSSLAIEERSDEITVAPTRFDQAGGGKWSPIRSVFDPVTAWRKGEEEMVAGEER